MSSSRVGQWMPYPLAIRRQLRRAFGEASRRRGNHSRGTDRIRPSSSVTTRESSVNATVVAIGSLLTKVAMPLLEEVFGMLARELPDSARFRTCEAPSIDQLYGREPQFRAAIAFLHVHVR